MSTFRTRDKNTLFGYHDLTAALTTFRLTAQNSPKTAHKGNERRANHKPLPSAITTLLQNPNNDESKNSFACYLDLFWSGPKNNTRTTEQPDIFAT